MNDDDGTETNWQSMACEKERLYRSAESELKETLAVLVKIRADRDAALATIAKVRAGEDATPAEAGTYRTAGSWWHFLLEAEPEARMNMISALLRGFRGEDTPSEDAGVRS